MVYYSPIADYCSSDITNFFNLKAKFGKWVSIWQSQIKTLVSIGRAPETAYEEISSVEVNDELVAKFKDYERVTHHDINAGIKYLSELCPIAAKFIHERWTSMDVDDNGRVLQQCDALDYIIDKARGLSVNLDDFHFKGKRPSGPIGHSQDMINGYGPELAAKISNGVMADLGLDYFPRTSQIYPREQDLSLADYLIGVADHFVYLANEFNPSKIDEINSLKKLMVSRREALVLNSAYDLEHRTIADSVVRRIEIPELFMFLDGIMNVYSGADFKPVKWVNPLNRYASKDMVEALNNGKFCVAGDLLTKGLVNAVNFLSKEVEKFRGEIYYARTHGQPAQLTTFGRALSLTLDKLVGYVSEAEGLIDPVSVVKFVSKFGSSFSKFSNDLVFWQSKWMMFEPFLPQQVGSSAMPYKRNPNKAERIIGLNRMLLGRSSYVINEGEHVLDIELPEVYLIADSIIQSFNYIVSREVKMGGEVVSTGLTLIRDYVDREIDELKFQKASTSLLTKATDVKPGLKRESVHNELRDIMFNGGGLEGIKESVFFKEIFGQTLASVVDELASTNPLSEVGTSLEDVDQSLKSARELLSRPEYAKLIGGKAGLSV